MKTVAPAAWVAIIVFLLTIASCVAMILIAQQHAWSPQGTPSTPPSSILESADRE